MPKTKTATLDEVLATFSAHISKSYPSPENFRRNFALLLEGKRGRSGEAEYAVSLEKNIVFLNDLVAEAEGVLGSLLLPAPEGGLEEEELAARLGELEEHAHGQTAKRHRELFVEGTGDEFRELRAGRSAGGTAYLDQLEFNYRYLMTMRIFLFEFLGVLAAIRTEYALEKVAAGAGQRIRNHLEVTAHYYLGNVAVSGGEGVAGGAREGTVH